MDLGRAAIQIVGVTEEDAEDIEKWRMIIDCGNS